MRLLVLFAQLEFVWFCVFDAFDRFVSGWLLRFACVVPLVDLVAEVLAQTFNHPLPYYRSKFERAYPS